MIIDPVRAVKRVVLASTLTVSVLAITSAQAAAVEIEVGGSYICSGATQDKAVLIWVGKIDPNGETSDPSNGAIISVSIRGAESGELPSIGHAPIDAKMFDDCRVADTAFPEAARTEFDEGYSTWRAAFDKNEGGIWTLSPSEIYWIALGVVEP